MGVFDDKKFEQLDWMTQMTETIESEMNGLLARLPDRINIDADKILSNVSGGRFSLPRYGVVRELINNLEEKSMLTYDEYEILAGCFRFEGPEQVEFNASSGTLTHGIALVKTVATIEDAILQKIMGRRGLEQLRFERFAPVPEVLGRMNEILDMLGKCESEMRNKSANKKQRAIVARLTDVFATNEWRIRDTTLANKVCFWIKGYIKDGNLPDLINFSKLKVMTHSNMPIYSVEEEK